MPKFRKKPVVIEAMQWNGDWDSMEQIEKELNVITLQRSGRQNINWVESWNIKRYFHSNLYGGLLVTS